MDYLDSNAKITEEATAFCFAVSNFTGFTTFYEYNGNGVSSSLSKVSVGTSHEIFPVQAKRTVLVLEAMVPFSAIHSRNTKINRLKLDMQGYELTTLRNIRDLLDDDSFILHIKAECFCPRSDNNKQIYEVDNSCVDITSLLRESGYETSGGECRDSEWSDVTAHKKAPGLDFLPESDWEGERPAASELVCSDDADYSFLRHELNSPCHEDGYSQGNQSCRECAKAETESELNREKV